MLSALPIFLLAVVVPSARSKGMMCHRSALLIFVGTMLLPAAQGKSMKGCHHHKHKMMKKAGCGLPKPPTKKPVGRKAPTRKPSSAPATAAPTPNRCPEFVATGMSQGYMYALVDEEVTRDEAFTTAATYRCCGAQGMLSPYNERSSVVIDTFLGEGSTAHLLETDSSSQCHYAFFMDWAGDAYGPCDAERLSIVEFACV
jgi:hypothetical protein